MSEVEAAPKPKQWSALGTELRKRTTEPFFHPSFVIYFVVAVVMVGGAGFWLELYAYFFPPSGVPATPPSAAAIRTAVITFFPALAGSSCMQLILAEEHQKFLRAFAIFVLCALSILALSIASDLRVENKPALTFGLLGSIVALWTWWIANARQRDLLDPDAPLGKRDPESTLVGNLNGFKV